MEAPARQILARLPLAEAVLTLWRWVADADALDQIFDENRGRCYQKILTFSLIVSLIRDALLEYGGSGRKSFEEAQDRGQLETSFRAAYGKLGRIPIPVSTAFLAECTTRLHEVYPQESQAQTPIPEGAVALMPRIMRLFGAFASQNVPESASREAASIANTTDAPLANRQVIVEVFPPGHRRALRCLN